MDGLGKEGGSAALTTNDLMDPSWLFDLDIDAGNELDDHMLQFDQAIGDFAENAHNTQLPNTREGNIVLSEPEESIQTQKDPLDLSSLLQVAHQEQAPESHRRSLPRRRSKYLLRRSRSGTRPIAFAASPLDESDPSLAIQRWQESPPEEEAASLSDIYNALQRQQGMSQPLHSQNLNAFRTYRGTPTASHSGASTSSIQSGNSSHSAASATSQPGRSRKMGANVKRRRNTQNAGDRIFKCTFCCDTFKHKYDWSRHEKSLHLNMEEWHCAPHGGCVLMPMTGRIHCAYCNVLDPGSNHLEEHNYGACRNDELAPRTFRRKDHLVQHLRLVHHLDTLPLIDDWRIEAAPIVSRCGFCNATLSSWNERTDHLAAHFRKGKTMNDWQGDHGFDPTIAARVTSALPPYLIASESLSLVPFSATNPSSIDHFHQISSQIERFSTSNPSYQHTSCPMAEPLSITNLEDQQNKRLSGHDSKMQQEIDTVAFTEILTGHLSRFAREHMAAGTMPTDAMFQREARRVLYDDESDAWYQTVADKPDWLNAFRQQYGC